MTSGRCPYTERVVAVRDVLHGLILYHRRHGDCICRCRGPGQRSLTRSLCHSRRLGHHIGGGSGLSVNVSILRMPVLTNAETACSESYVCDSVTYKNCNIATVFASYIGCATPGQYSCVRVMCM